MESEAEQAVVIRMWVVSRTLHWGLCVKDMCMARKSRCFEEGGKYMLKQ